MTRQARPLRATADVQRELSFEESSHVDQCLIGASSTDLYRAFARLDWDLASATTDEFTHGVHSYPAKFIPQLPKRFISTLSRPGDLVIDPFSGGGTTGVECLRLGRSFLGVDANAVGVLLGSVKTTPLTDADKAALLRLIETLQRLQSSGGTSGTTIEIPDIPNVDKWYAPHVVVALAEIRSEVRAITNHAARDLAMAAFANTAARMSFQESESRYVSKPRPVSASETYSRCISEVERMTARVDVLQSTRDVPDVRYELGDARQRGAFPVRDGDAGLVVTSPPYPNAYDYHLYHRFRLLWLGEKPSDLRRVEIGSHLKHQADRDPIASYEADMRAVLRNLHALLAVDRHCVLVVGDGIYSGETYPTAARLSEMASEDGWEALPPITRALPETRRAVTAAGRRLRAEQILILRKRPNTSRLRLIAPTYNRFPYESDLAARETVALGGILPTAFGEVDVPTGEVSAVVERLKGSAFWHGIEIVETGEQIATTQRVVEDVSGGKRKHSTYLTHGLHRYKGKFYPQLAKALLNLSEIPEPHSLVLDPFGGSGTVLLESVLSGRDAVSIDCNPLATAVARAKVGVLQVPPALLTTSLTAMLNEVGDFEAGSTDWTQFEKDTHDELASWFAPAVLSKLALLLSHIRTLPDPRLVSFFEVVVSDLVRDVSHQDPRDLRIRRRNEPLQDAPLLELFSTRAAAVVAKVMALTPDGAAQLGEAEAVLGTSTDPRSFDSLGERRVGAVISSPPYATALPYLDTDRLSLAAVYGWDKKRRGQLEAQLIGSRETTRSLQRSVEILIEAGLADRVPASTTTFLQELLDAVRRDDSAGFRKQQLPSVLARYFLGVAEVLANVRAVLEQGAHLWFVLGDSRSQIGGKQWVIPTVEEFRSIAKHSGLELVESVPITVTREDVVHARHSITDNAVLHFQLPA